MSFILRVSLFATGAVGWCFLLPTLTTPFWFGPQEGSERLSWWVLAAIGYAVLLVGVILGVMCRGLLARQQQLGPDTQIDITAHVKSSLRTVNFWLSTLASPIIYGLVLRSGADLAIGAFLFFALQTGFSSHLLLDSIVAGGGLRQTGPVVQQEPNKP